MYESVELALKILLSRMALSNMWLTSFVAIRGESPATRDSAFTVTKTAVCLAGPLFSTKTPELFGAASCNAPSLSINTPSGAFTVAVTMILAEAPESALDDPSALSLPAHNTANRQVMIRYLIAVLEDPLRDFFGQVYFQEAADMGNVKNSFLGQILFAKNF